MEDNRWNPSYSTYGPGNASYNQYNQQEEEKQQNPTQLNGAIKSLLQTALAQIAQLQEYIERKESKASAHISTPLLTSTYLTAVTIKPQKPDIFDGQRGGLSTDAWLFQLE